MSSRSATRKTWRLLLVSIAGLLVCGCQQTWSPVSGEGAAGHPVRRGTRFVWTFDEDDATDFLSTSGSWTIARDPVAVSGRGVMRAQAGADPTSLAQVVVPFVTFDDASLRIRCRSSAPLGEAAD